MTRPSRATIGGRVYLDLRRLARTQGRPTAELLQLYALEAFLARLPQSEHDASFVLKGGALLAAFNARRPTNDVDLAATRLSNESQVVLSAIRTILEVQLDDGIHFAAEATQAEVIREGAEYSGVRVTVPCKLSTAKLRFHVDVSLGDPIFPPPATVSVPRLLGGDPLILAGYPLAMVLAEKIVTALQRGTANTRWRDFADIVTLSRRHTLLAVELEGALRIVASHRLETLQPLDVALSGFPALAQPGWTAWLRRAPSGHGLPTAFGDLLSEITAFVDPLLAQFASAVAWNPLTRRWE